MSNSQQNGGDDRTRLARTMRIDIPADVVSQSTVPGAPKKVQRRIITRRVRGPATFRTTVAELKKQGTAEAPAPSTTSDFQQLLQSVYDAAIIVDMAGNIMEVNIRALDFLLYNREELLQLSILDVISGADESTLAAICQHLTERFVLIEQCYCARKDGTLFPAEASVNKLSLSGADYLCFFVRDITVRREAEEKFRVAYSAIQNSLSGIAITDVDARIQSVNPAVCRMWGYEEPEELVGKDIRELWRKTDEDAELLQSVVDRKLGLTCEVVAVRDDGKEFDVQVIAAANTDSDGRLVGMVFSLVDISDRKRAEQAEREAERQRVMLASLGAACHHLGQPATVLLADLGIMQRKTVGQQKDLCDLVRHCVEAAESMAGILQRLNTVNEYRTTPYLEGQSTDDVDNRILEI